MHLHATAQRENSAGITCLLAALLPAAARGAARLEAQHLAVVAETPLAMALGKDHDPQRPKNALLPVLPRPCTERLIGIREDAIMQDARPVSYVNQHLEPPFR